MKRKFDSKGFYAVLIWLLGIIGFFACSYFLGYAISDKSLLLIPQPITQVLWLAIIGFLALIAIFWGLCLLSLIIYLVYFTCTKEIEGNKGSHRR